MGDSSPELFDIYMEKTEPHNKITGMRHILFMSTGLSLEAHNAIHVSCENPMNHLQ